MLWRARRIWRLAAKSLWLHRLRSTLTALGVVFGVMSVVAMLAIGEGASFEAQQQIRRLGSRNLILQSVKPPESSSAAATISWVVAYGLTQQDYEAVLETNVAYMTFRFNLTVEMVRRARPDAIEARIEGAPIGLVGRLAATSVTRLVEDEDGTRIHYSIDSALTGRLGSLGQPVLKAKAREMEKQFAARLCAAFEKAAPAEPR